MGPVNGPSSMMFIADSPNWSTIGASSLSSPHHHGSKAMAAIGEMAISVYRFPPVRSVQLLSKHDLRSQLPWRE